MVKHRNPVMVIVLTVITLGIYGIYWVVSTTKELRSLKADAPNPWALVLFIIPLVNIIVALWYYWKYSGAVEEISGFSAVLLFLLWIVFSPAAVVIAQIQLNKRAAVARPSPAVIVVAPDIAVRQRGRTLSCWNAIKAGRLKLASITTPIKPPPAASQ